MRSNELASKSDSIYQFKKMMPCWYYYADGTDLNWQQFSNWQMQMTNSNITLTTSGNATFFSNEFLQIEWFMWRSLFWISSANILLFICKCLQMIFVPDSQLFDGVRIVVLTLSHKIIICCQFEFCIMLNNKFVLKTGYDLKN